jgi:hypothetical protein
MLLGAIVGVLMGWEMVQGSGDGDLGRLLSADGSGWVLVGGAIVLLLLVAVASPGFVKACAPCVIAASGWAALDAGRMRDMALLWPMVVLAVGVFAAFMSARQQRILPRLVRNDSARVVRDYLRTHQAG